MPAHGPSRSIGRHSARLEDRRTIIDGVAELKVTATRTVGDLPKAWQFLETVYKQSGIHVM